MNMPAIREAICEASLLFGAGIPTLDAFEILRMSHEPDAAALFAELATDWTDGTPGQEWKTVGPFAARAGEEPAFAVAVGFATVGAMTTMLEYMWADMAVAFLLYAKLAGGEPADADIALGAYLMSAGAFTEKNPAVAAMRAWSDAPAWRALAPAAPVDATFPAAWWQQFPFDEKEQEQLPSPGNGMLVTALTQAGALERQAGIERKWHRFRAVSRVLSA